MRSSPSFFGVLFRVPAQRVALVGVPRKPRVRDDVIQRVTSSDE